MNSVFFSLAVLRPLLLVGLTIVPCLTTIDIAVAQTQPLSKPSTTPCAQSKLALEWHIKLKPLANSRSVPPEQLQQTQSVLQQRIEQLAVTESVVKPVGPDQMLIQLPSLPEERVTQALLLPNQLEFRQAKPKAKQQILALLQQRRTLSDQQQEVSRRSKPDRKKQAELKQALFRNDQQLLSLFEPTQLTGSYIKQASVEQQSSMMNNVIVVFDDRGSQLIAELTKRSARIDEPIGIFLDNELIMAPTTPAAYQKTGITGGQIVISGAFTQQDAQEIATRLQASRFSLPLPLEVMKTSRIKRQSCRPTQP